jgi:hypothetical protein
MSPFMPDDDDDDDDDDDERASNLIRMLTCILMLL